MEGQFSPYKKFFFLFKQIGSGTDIVLPRSPFGVHLSLQHDGGVTFDILNLNICFIRIYSLTYQ